MRILHVIQSLDPAKGGPSEVAARLAAAQCALGHEVAILSNTGPQGDETVCRSLGSIEHIDAVQRPQIESRSLWRQAIAGLVDSQFAQWISVSDVLHLHGVWEPMLLRVSRLATRMNTPYFLMPHGLLDDFAIRHRRLKKKFALALAWGRLLRDACAVICATEGEAHALQRRGYQGSCVVIPHGVHIPASFAKTPNHGSSDNNRYIVFLGRLHPIKGLDFLIDAYAESGLARQSDPTGLWLVGPDGGQQADLEARIVELKLSGHIRIMGPVFGDQKYEILANAHLYVQPSRYESFGLSVLEAMALGVPALTSDQCRLGPDLAALDAAVIEPLDVQRWATRLHELFSSPGQLRNLGLRGRQRVLSRYTWPRIAQQTIDMYQQMLSQADR